MAAEFRALIRWGRRSDHIFGEAGTAAAGTWGYAAGNRSLHRADNEMSAGQID